MRAPPRFRWIALIAYALLVLTLTHLPPPQLGRIPIHVGDSTAHRLAYLGLAFLSNWAAAGATTARRSLRRTAGLLIPVFALFGAVDEWTQPLFSRGCELRDWFNDMFGVAAGSLVALAWFRCVDRRSLT